MRARRRGRIVITSSAAIYCCVYGVMMCPCTCTLCVTHLASHVRWSSAPVLPDIPQRLLGMRHMRQPSGLCAACATPCAARCVCVRRQWHQQRLTSHPSRFTLHTRCPAQLLGTGVSMHIATPLDTDTPGFVEENKTKVGVVSRSPLHNLPHGRLSFHVYYFASPCTTLPQPQLVHDLTKAVGGNLFSPHAVAVSALDGLERGRWVLLACDGSEYLMAGHGCCCMWSCAAFLL